MSRNRYMVPYLALIGARLRLETQYRAAAIFGMCTQIFWGLVRVAIFTAFYKAGTAHLSMTLAQTVTYLWLVQAFIRIMPWNVDPEIRAMVHQGTVVYELLRPVDLFWAWYIRALAGHSIPTAMRSAPIFLVASLFLGLQLPYSIVTGFEWFIALILAILLAAAITTLLNVSLLFTIVGDGIQRVVPAISNFASGMLIPLTFLPLPLQSFIDFLPFRDLIDTPVRIYLGLTTETQTLFLYIHALIWIALLIFTGRSLMRIAVSRFEVQGG